MYDFGTRYVKGHGVEGDLEDVFLYEDKLTLLSKLEERNTYLAEISFYDKDDKVVNKISYEASVAYIGREKGKGIICRLEKSAFFINEKEPSLVIEQMATELNTVLYPLEVFVHFTGKLIGVKAIKAVQERWHKRKQKFTAAYQGDIAYQMVKQFENAINNEGRLLGLLQKDFFIQLFFHTIYQEYSPQLTLETSFHYNSNGSSVPLTFKGLSTIEPKVTKSETIVVHYEGECEIDGMHQLSRHLKNPKGNKGTLNIKYDLDKKTRIPEMIQMATSWEAKDGKHLKTVEVLISKSSGRKTVNVLVEDEKKIETPEKQKGLFSFFKKNKE